MRKVILLSLIVAGCAPRVDDGCPAVSNLVNRDAVADARAALAKGDRKLLMLGGYVGEVPGVPNVRDHPTEMMEGTSDTETEACMNPRLRDVAAAYASKYNRTVVASDRR
jgi:hypothetical protein